MKRSILRQNNLSFFLLGVATAALVAASFVFWQQRQERLAASLSSTAQEATSNPASAPLASPAAIGKDQIVLELFNPSDQSLTHQLNKTNLSQQIEQALTISFILTKCSKLSDAEFGETFRALILYAQKMHLADGADDAEKLVRRISESSGASYSLIYSRLSCTSPQLPQLAIQLKNWVNGIMTPTP